MFNQGFMARVDGFSAKIRTQAGNNDEQPCVSVSLLYELDDALASEIGGPAPGVLNAMVADYDDGKIGAVPISLNSKAVNVRLKVGRKTHTIGNTISLTVRAMPPTAKNLSAMLQVKVGFLASEADVASLWEVLGKTVTVRMDREQLELPGMGPAEIDSHIAQEMAADPALGADMAITG